MKAILIYEVLKYFLAIIVNLVCDCIFRSKVHNTSTRLPRHLKIQISAKVITKIMQRHQRVTNQMASMLYLQTAAILSNCFSGPEPGWESCHGDQAYELSELIDITPLYSQQGAKRLGTWW